jgi:hypothetical protein
VSCSLDKPILSKSFNIIDFLQPPQDLNKGRQKIKIGQTFLTGKAINSEIIIDDIEVIVDNKGDSIFGELINNNIIFISNNANIVI